MTYAWDYETTQHPGAIYLFYSLSCGILFQTYFSGGTVKSESWRGVGVYLLKIISACPFTLQGSSGVGWLPESVAGLRQSLVSGGSCVSAAHRYPCCSDLPLRLLPDQLSLPSHHSENSTSTQTKQKQANSLAPIHMH